MPNPVQNLQGKTLTRGFTVAPSAVNVEARTVELAFSSETLVPRWFGLELLDHSPNSVRMGRLNNRAPLLNNHCPDDQVGVVDSARIDSDRIGRATVRFSRSVDGEEFLQDVADGIRTHVSVGYQVHAYNEETTIGPDGQSMTVVRVTDWEPYEITFASIAADDSVGVGRSMDAPRAVPDAINPEPVTVPESPPARVEIVEERNHAMTQAQETPDDKRVRELLDTADAYKDYGAREMVGDFLRTRKSVEQFQRAILDKIQERHSNTSDLAVGMSATEVRQYSLARAVLAQASGDWSKAGLEREASFAVAKRSGMEPQGFYIPMDAMGKRAFTVGTAAEAGNLVATNVAGNEFVDVLRNSLIMAKLGARIMAGLSSNLAIPRKTATATAASYSEIGAITASNPSTAQIVLSPKRVGTQVPFSKQSLIQGSLDVETMLMDDILQGIAVQTESLAINGTAANNQPRGLVNQSGIGAVVGGTNGAQIGWSHIVDLESACANVNAEPDTRAGYLINTKTRGWLKKTVSSTYGDFIWTPGQQNLNDYRAAVTNNVTATATKGTSSGVCSNLFFGSDWSQFIIAFFGSLDIVVDPFTLAGTAQLQITANQFVDFACRQPGAFSAMADGLPQ